MRLLIPLVLALFFLSCDTEKKAPITTTESTQSAPAAVKPTYPVYPKDKLQYLFDNSDYVDYVFFELPVSMSLSEKESVRYSVSHVSLSPAPLNPECKAIGRIFYQLKGENIAEADIYFNMHKQCNYYVFYENGKKTYANLMTEQGTKYLEQNLTNVAKSIQQAAQGGGR